MHQRVGVRSAKQMGVWSSSRAVDVILHFGCAYGPAIACGGPDPRPGIRWERLPRKLSFRVCELGSLARL
jgi:hypothetical protein